MLRTAPYLAICSSGPYPDSEWVNHSAKPLSDVSQYVSLHHYVAYPQFTDTNKYKEEYDAFMKETSTLKSLAWNMRKSLHDEKLRISFDEWNSWYAWYRPESVCDGIFAAKALHMFISEADKIGIDIVCHFEAVNEGAILVDKTSAKFTPMGNAFSVMKHHRLGKILFADDNVVATEKDGIIKTTIINTSYDEEKEYKIPACKEDVEGVLYSSNSVLPNSVFKVSNVDYAKESDYYCIKMPPHSMVLFIQK